MWVRVAQGDVAPRRVAGCEYKDEILTCAVIDARGLEQKSIRRIEECGKDLDRGKITRQADIGERGRNDDRGDKDG